MSFLRPANLQFIFCTSQCGTIILKLSYNLLTHWGRVTHISVNELIIIGSDNGLSPSQRQAIIWTNAGILLIGHLGTYFSEILIRIHTFSFKKMHLKMLSAKWRPFCLGLNVLNSSSRDCYAIPVTTLSYSPSWCIHISLPSVCTKSKNIKKERVHDYIWPILQML